MIIVYHCYGGTHSSVTAASLHLQKLNLHSSGEDLLALPLFDRLTAATWGRLFYHGTDKWGNRIYSLGRGNRFFMIYNFYQSLTQESQAFTLLDDIVFIDTLPCVNISMRVGGFLSRYLGLAFLGRPLCVKGTLRALPSILELVEKVRNNYGRKR